MAVTVGNIGTSVEVIRVRVIVEVVTRVRVIVEVVTRV